MHEIYKLLKKCLTIFICRESTNTSWLIANVSSHDEGYYDCFATSSAGSGQARTFLDVNGK